MAGLMKLEKELLNCYIATPSANFDYKSHYLLNITALYFVYISNCFKEQTYRLHCADMPYIATSCCNKNFIPAASKILAA